MSERTWNLADLKDIPTSFPIQVGSFTEGISERNPVSTLECPSIPSLSLLVDSRAAACQIAREPKFNNFGYLSLRPPVGHSHGVRPSTAVAQSREEDLTSERAECESPFLRPSTLS